jgi:hypothetical protein
MSSGLVAAYAFDEGSGTTVADVSGNGDNGTLKNGPVWTTGKYDSALSFDGVNDYVAIPNSSSLNISSTKLTLPLWVNFTDTGSDMVLISKPWFSSSKRANTSSTYLGRYVDSRIACQLI